MHSTNSKLTTRPDEMILQRLEISICLGELVADGRLAKISLSYDELNINRTAGYFLYIYFRFNQFRI
jgi:hypothetical protein